MTTPLISVICCAHNEEKYVDRSVPGMLHALKGFKYEIVFVADRCTDNTVEKVEKYKIKLIEKNWEKWGNSYAESLQTGYLQAKGDYIAIIDADILVPFNFFRDLVPMINNDVVSVAPPVVTYPDTLWNRIMHSWEKMYRVAPLGREPRGAARIILRRSLNEISGFKDVPTPDTGIDIQLIKKGYKSISTSAVKVYHIRHISFGTMIGGQINRGRGRYVLGVGLVRTLGHALFRLRPFLLGGWFMEWMKRRGN